MDKMQILEQFALLAGLETGEALCYSALADSVIDRVHGMLRSTISPEEHACRLTALCSALCYYEYTLRQKNVSEESIRALNVSVTRKCPAPHSGAEALRNEAILAARDLLCDNRFYCS